MAEYQFTNKAVEDLTAIWEYTFSKWSEEQANKYYNLIIESCQDIAENPETGKNYTGVNSRLFGLKAKKHIIFYRKLIDKPIEIIRILHERMDLKSRLNKKRI